MKVEVKLYLSCFIFFLFQSITSGVQYPFKFYSSKDGLHNKSVFSICMDHRGYIWFGTNNGGLYYLNSGGINYKHDPGDFNNSNIRKLYFTKNKELFIGTEKGLFVDNGLVLNEIEFDSLNEIKVVEIFQDSRQNVWIGTANNGLYLLKFSDQEQKFSNPVSIQNVSSTTFFSICEDNMGRIWAGGFGGGVDIITIENNTPVIKKPGFFLHKNEKLITSLKYIGNQSILIGTYGAGILKVNYNKTVYKLDSYLDSPQLLHSIIWDIEKDNSNAIWIATDKKGLIKIDGESQIYYNTRNGLPSNQILNLCASQKQMWIGTIGNGIGSLLSEHIKFYEDEKITQNKLITSAVKYNNYSILVGTYGAGVYKINIADSTLPLKESIAFLSPLKDKYVNTFFYNGGNAIYIGTANMGLYEVTRNNYKVYSREDGILLNSINTVYKSTDNRIWVGTNAGLSIISERGIFNIDDKQEYAIPNNEIQCIYEDHYKRIWIGTLGGLSCIDKDKITNYNSSDGLLSERINSLYSDKSNLWIGTDGGGLFYVDLSTKSIIIKQHTEISARVNNILSVRSISDSILVLGTDRGLELVLIDSSMTVLKHKLIDLNIGFSAGELIQNQIIALNSGNIITVTNQGLIQIALNEILKTTDHIGRIYIEKIELPLQDDDLEIEPDNIINWQNIPKKLTLKYYQNYISFQLASDIIINDAGYDFEYRLAQNKNQAWLKSGENGIIALNNLRFGKYRLQARLVDFNNNSIAENLNYNFEIRPPFYYTWWFLVTAIIIIILAVYTIIKIREKNLRQRNIQLENTVQQRTYEILQQKDQITKQKEIIELKNKDITDSINYASKIQEALLPSEKTLANNFRGYFILYMPRDIVSGDFYWIQEKSNKTICVLADCTGHGVPGAFMSMLGLSLLSEIVMKNNITSPEIIINRLRGEIIKTLKQDDPSNPRDGMDLAVCVFDRSLKNLLFAGANSSVQIIRNNEIIELKGDRMPAAFYYEMESFELQTLALEQDDCIYMFTDGYADQFGGEDGKKFMKKPLKRLLQEISNNEFSDQKSILKNNLDKWMKDYEQVDDISVLGLKI